MERFFSNWYRKDFTSNFQSITGFFTQSEEKLDFSHNAKNFNIFTGHRNEGHIEYHGGKARTLERVRPMSADWFSLVFN